MLRASFKIYGKNRKENLIWVLDLILRIIKSAVDLFDKNQFYYSRQWTTNHTSLSASQVQMV